MKRILTSALIVVCAVSLVVGFFVYTDWKDKEAKRAYIEELMNQQEKNYKEGLAAYNRGDYDEAVKFLSKCSLPEAKKLLAAAKLKARDFHVTRAEAFKKKKKYDQAAVEYAFAYSYDRSNKKLRDLADSSTIRKEVNAAIRRIEATRTGSGSGKRSYTRSDVASYSIGSISKSGNNATVSGTATMRDGSVLSGHVNLVKINGKWSVVGYSY